MEDIADLKYLEEHNFYIDDLNCAEAKESDRCASFLSTIKFTCLPGYEFENNAVEITVCLEEAKWSPVSKCVKCNQNWNYSLLNHVYL